MGELTYKQRLFVEAYIRSGGNGTEAAISAGYGAPAQAASRLLTYAKIQAALSRRVESAAMAANEVLARISEIATTDIGEYLSIGPESWSVRLRRGQRTRLIRKLKQTKRTIDEIETEITEIEVKDSLPALVKLGEYHSLWDREPEPEVDLKSIAERMQQRRAKRAKRDEPT